MHALSAQAIVLHRTNYGEADRIITSLTHDGKKISLFAKGVRKPKSKLMVGTELFCIVDISYIQNSSQKMATLTSAKIVKQHTNFLNNLDKVQLAYDVLKVINKHTEDIEAARYFTAIERVLLALDTQDYNVDIVRIWAWLQILATSGHQIQLSTQVNDEPFIEDTRYIFDIGSGGFIQSDAGQYVSEHIKFLRVALLNDIATVQRIKHANQLALDLKQSLNLFVESTY